MNNLEPIWYNEREGEKRPDFFIFLGKSIDCYIFLALLVNDLKERFQERYLSREFIERHLNKFNALRQGDHMVPEYEARFMELLRYAPHLNTEKLKVKRFVFGFNGSIRANVRILMPQTLHDVVQKSLIAEEKLISGDQSRTPGRPGGKVSSGAQQHQTPTKHMMGYRGF
jgi:hypothetical protein